MLIRLCFTHVHKTSQLQYNSNTSLKEVVLKLNGHSDQENCLVVIFVMCIPKYWCATPNDFVRTNCLSVFVLKSFFVSKCCPRYVFPV